MFVQPPALIQDRGHAAKNRLPTFTQRLALDHAKLNLVVTVHFTQEPHGFELLTAPLTEVAHMENALLKAVGDAQCVRKQVCRGFFVHSIT